MADMIDLDPLSVLLLQGPTGKILEQVPFKSARWAEGVNDEGSLSVVVPLGRDVIAHELRRKAAAWRNSLAIVRGDTDVLQAGPITSISYAPTSGEVTFTAGGGLTYFKKRLAFHRNLNHVWKNGEVLIDEDHPADAWELRFKGSQRSIVYRLVWEARRWEDLPVYCPDAESGSYDMSWLAPDLKTTADAIADVVKQDEGIEVVFHPEMSGDRTHVRWRVKGGAPEVVTNHWYMSASAPGSRVILDKMDEDGSAITRDVYGVGGRKDDKVLVARSRSTTMYDYPLMQVGDSSHSSESSARALAGWTSYERQTNARPVDSYSLKVGAERRVRAGDWIDLGIEDDPWMGTTTLSLKVTDVSGDEGEWLTVACVRR